MLEKLDAISLQARQAVDVVNFLELNYKACTKEKSISEILFIPFNDKIHALYVLNNIQNKGLNRLVKFVGVDDSTSCEVGYNGCPDLLVRVFFLEYLKNPKNADIIKQSYRMATNNQLAGETIHRIMHALFHLKSEIKDTELNEFELDLLISDKVESFFKKEVGGHIIEKIYQFKQVLEVIESQELNRFAKKIGEEEKSIITSISSGFIRRVYELALVQLSGDCLKEKQSEMVNVLAGIFSEENLAPKNQSQQTEDFK